MQLFLLTLIFYIGSCTSVELHLEPESDLVIVNDVATFTVYSSDPTTEEFVTVSVLEPDYAEIVGSNTNVTPATFQVKGLLPGHVVINATCGDFSVVYYHLTVQKSADWTVVADVIGWLYFAAWSVSFYPQIFDNWKRKSVVGLNLDFLALNLVGFFLYSLFNGGMFWIRAIQDQYQESNPTSVNPVLINDIFFSFHALFAVIITIGQCFIYERGDQTLSLPVKGLLGVYFAFLVISAICAAADAMTWLLFLYFCSYVKLSITLIKYIPQAYMNYRRKSTVGWSVGNVFLDFTGGILSMAQMIVNSWNYDDWASIFGDATKFGLGLFSVIFDIFFLIQHYILYRQGDTYLDFPGGVYGTNSRTELAT